ncbi:hypothetical protein BT69DRAFT_1296160 [Atractiella rhizophila]|nr:hypothetical protein BT69DRAFT_1296160 [Atractiella rhizophila]
MQTNGYKVSDNLSVHTLFSFANQMQFYAMASAYLLDPSTVSFKTAHTKLMGSDRVLSSLPVVLTSQQFSMTMLISMLRQFVKLDLELEAQGKKVTVKATASKKHKCINLLGECNNDDEEENLSLWDPLDKELAAMSKMKHADRFTYTTILPGT